MHTHHITLCRKWRATCLCDPIEKKMFAPRCRGSENIGRKKKKGQRSVKDDTALAWNPGPIR